MESRATITTENNSSFPDNNTKYITAAFMRAFQEIINASKFNLVDDDLSNINFSDADFVATNALAAMIEVNNKINNSQAFPLFYVDVNVDSDASGVNSATFVGTNYATGSVTTATTTGGWTINFTNTFTQLGVNLGYAVCRANVDQPSARNVVGQVINTKANFWPVDKAGGALVSLVRVYFFAEPSTYLVG